MRRHALDWITHRPQRPQRPRIDTERHRLAAAQPAADVCPIVNLRRSQRRGAGCREGALDRPLHRPAALGRRARPFAQIRVMCPFHWRLMVFSELPKVGDFVPGYEASQWYGMAAPKNTPVHIID